MKEGFVVFLSSVLYSFVVVAGECDWAKITPNEDSNYQYFVAREYSKTIDDAQNKAERDIDNQISRLFGTEIITQSEYYQDERVSSGTTRTKERVLGSIVLKGLKKQKSNTEKTRNGYFACVQYSYDKKEIEKEKVRLSSSVGSIKMADIIYNEVEGDVSCRGMPVSITTQPSGAFITLNDGKYQGYSPIKFGNVCYGEYSIKITKDNYEDIVEKLIVGNKEVNINKKLKKGIKEVSITTNLGGSTLLVNGVDMGIEPVKIKVPYGEIQEIEAINPQANSITRRVSFYKDSSSDYVFTLDKKPAIIDFSAFRNRNTEVDIYVDGKKIAGNSIYGLSASSHFITFKKKGFRDINKTIELKGGEINFYNSDRLNFVESKADYWHDENGVSVGKTRFGISVGKPFTTGETSGSVHFDLFGEIKSGRTYLRMAVFGDFLDFDETIKVGGSYDDSYHFTGWTFYHDYESYSKYYDAFTINIGLNLTDKLSAYGIYKLGYVPDDEILEDKYPSKYGVGLSYDLTNAHSLRLDYTKGKFEEGGKRVELDSISLYISVNFKSKSYKFEQE